MRTTTLVSRNQFAYGLAVRLFCCVALALACHEAAFAAPLQVNEIKRENDVDFEKEILPILRRSCLACHNAKVAESKFVAETPQLIVRGGSTGAAVIPGNAAESLLFKVASHQIEPIMPPEGNDAQAKDLSPDELGLIRVWIDQGAKGNVSSGNDSISWRTVPEGVQAIYAAAVSPDGDYAAAAQGAAVAILQVGSKREVDRLHDPAIAQPNGRGPKRIADVDVVQSVRFSHDSQTLATGGFRSVKLWRRPHIENMSSVSIGGKPKVITTSADGATMAIGLEDGAILVGPRESIANLKRIPAHAGEILGLALSQDGTRLFSTSKDRTVRAWNWNEGIETGKIELPVEPRGIAYLAERNEIAVMGSDGVIRLWPKEFPAAEPGQSFPKPVLELGGHGDVSSLVSAGPTRLLAAGADGGARVWELTNSQVVLWLGHGSPIASVALAQDGKRIMSVGGQPAAKLFNGENGQFIVEQFADAKKRRSLDAQSRILSVARQIHNAATNDLAEAQKRKTAEEENEKKAREELTKAESDLTTKTEAAKGPATQKEDVEKQLATAREEREKAEVAKKQAVVTFQTTEKELNDSVAQREASVKALEAANAKLQEAAQSLTQAEQASATAPEDQDLKTKLEAAKKVREAAETDRQTAEKTVEKANLAVSELDQKKNQAAQAVQQTEQAFNERNQAVPPLEESLKQVTANSDKANQERMLAERALKSQQRAIERAVESVRVAGESIPPYEATMKRREQATQARQSEVDRANQVANDARQPWKWVSASKQGKYFVTANDLTLAIWDAETGAMIDVLEQPATASISAIFVDPTGNIWMGDATGQVTMWRFGTEWKLTKQFGTPDDGSLIPDRVTAIAFSHDGKLLATGSGEPSRSGDIRIWSLETGELLRTIAEPHSDCVLGLAFSPEDDLLASGGADRFCKVFQVEDGRLSRVFEGHTSHVTGVAWRADGRMLASSSADGTVKIWNPLTGEKLRSVAGFNKEVTAVRFLSDTDMAVCSGGSNLVRQIGGNGGNVIRDFPGVADYMHAADASDDGKVIIAAGQDGVLRIWNQDAQPLATIAPTK